MAVCNFGIQWGGGGEGGTSEFGTTRCARTPVIFLQHSSANRFVCTHVWTRGKETSSLQQALCSHHALFQPTGQSACQSEKQNQPSGSVRSCGWCTSVWIRLWQQNLERSRRPQCHTACIVLTTYIVSANRPWLPTCQEPLLYPNQQLVTSGDG